MPFSKNGTWVRKSGNELFGIIKGSFGGVEICELVGHYLLIDYPKYFEMTM